MTLVRTFTHMKRLWSIYRDRFNYYWILDDRSARPGPLDTEAAAEAYVRETYR